MRNSDYADNKTLVGFFNLFYNYGETCRSVLIAKEYLKLGGKVIFFSHGGEYEYLAEDLGCKIVRINPIYSNDYINLLWESSRFNSLRNPFSKEILMEHVEEEINAYKQTGVKIIVSTNNFPCFISTRAAGIPFISVTPKVIPHFSIYPDDAEFFFTRVLPSYFKLKILNWYSPKSKMYIRPFIKIAKKFNVTPPKTVWDLTKGDYTFFVDSLEFIGLEKSMIKPNEYYVGHTSFDKILKKSDDKNNFSNEQKKLEDHIKNDKSILLTFGSSGTKELFIKILKTLDNTEYNVIAIYSSIIKEEDIPGVNKNIILKKFAPSIKKLHEIVDLSIIHGGKGTVYTSAYAGKPIIGFPMQFEQHSNLERLVNLGLGQIESRRYFNGKKLLNSIKKIFNNYDIYLKNAKTLSHKLPKPEGDINSAKILQNLIKKDI